MRRRIGQLFPLLTTQLNSGHSRHGGAQVAHEAQTQESPALAGLLNLLIYLGDFGCGGRI